MILDIPCIRQVLILSQEVVSGGDTESLYIRVMETSRLRVDDMVIELVSEVQQQVKYAVSLTALVG